MKQFSNGRELEPSVLIGHAAADGRSRNYHKNSSGDEIANVNLLRRYRTCTLKYAKREPISFNKLDDS